MAKIKNSKPLALVFDLDDTLYSKADVFFNTFQKFAQTSLSPQELYHVYSQQSEVAFQLFNQEQLTLEESHVYRYSHLFDELGITLTDQEIKKFIHSYNFQQSQISLSQDWKKLLETLKDQYQLAILSNGPSQHQRHKLDALNIEPFIPESKWFISEELGFHKPHYQSFLAVEESLGLHPHQIVMVGDTLEADITGAQKCGWKSIWYQEHRQQFPTAHSASYKTAFKPQDILRLLDSPE